MSENQIELADDASTVSDSECSLDVVMSINKLEIMLTIRATVDRESDTVTWKPERVLSATWHDGEEILIEGAFWGTTGAWEAILREHHDAAIEKFARDWAEREDLSAERDRFLEAGLRMIVGSDV